MKHVDLLMERYAVLADCRSAVERATDALVRCFSEGGKLLLCGNGGSAADCDHIVGELMKGFLLPRPLSVRQREELRLHSPMLSETTLSRLERGLPAVSIPSITPLISAFFNDVDPELVYAQATLALGRERDVLLAISTSGNARNVLEAARVALGLGMCVIALTGESGGALAKIADIAVRVPERETFRVQELHLPVYHAICAEIEEAFFGEG